MGMFFALVRHRSGTRRSGEQFRVVNFALLEHHVRVRVRRDGEVALPDELSDPHPWHPAQMQQRDAAVAEVVRRPERDRGRPARLRYRGAERVGA